MNTELENMDMIEAKTLNTKKTSPIYLISLSEVGHDNFFCYTHPFFNLMGCLLMFPHFISRYEEEGYEKR